MSKLQLCVCVCVCGSLCKGGLAYVQAWAATKTTLLLMAHIWKMEEPDTWKRCDHYTDSNYPSGGSNGGGLSCTRTHTSKLAIKGGGQLNAMLFGEPLLTENKAWWQAPTRRFNKEKGIILWNKRGKKSGQGTDKKGKKILMLFINRFLMCCSGLRRERGVWEGSLESLPKVKSLSEEEFRPVRCSWRSEPCVSTPVGLEEAVSLSLSHSLLSFGDLQCHVCISSAL